MWRRSFLGQLYCDFLIPFWAWGPSHELLLPKGLFNSWKVKIDWKIRLPGVLNRRILFSRKWISLDHFTGKEYFSCFNSFFSCYGPGLVKRSLSWIFILNVNIIEEIKVTSQYYCPSLGGKICLVLWNLLIALGSYLVVDPLPPPACVHVWKFWFFGAIVLILCIC